MILVIRVQQLAEMFQLTRYKMIQVKWVQLLEKMFLLGVQRYNMSYHMAMLEANQNYYES